MDFHFRTIIEHSREAVVILQQCQIKYANQSASTIFGVPVGLLTGRDFLSFVHPDDREIVIQAISLPGSLAQEKVGETYSARIKYGEYAEKLLNLRIILLDWDEEPALICYLTDVSDDIKIERDLQEREAIFNALIDQAYNGIAVIQNGRLSYLNAQMAEIIGYTTAEIIDTDFSKYVHPDELPQVLNRYKQRMKGEDVPSRYESKLVHKNGRAIDVEFNADVVPYQGQPADFVFVRDISERKQQQAALERQNRELSTLFNASTVISSDLALNKVLEAVAVQMTHALGATGCSISLWHKAENVIETLVEFSFDPHKNIEKPGAIYELKDFPMILGVLERKIPCLIRSDNEDIRSAELAFMRENGMLVLLILPLVARDKVIGIAELFNDKAYQHFSGDDIKLASSLAAQAAVAVENAQLYEQAQMELVERHRAESRAKRYLDQQIIVNQLALTLGQLSNLEEIYQAIYVQVSSLLSVDAFIISFYREETQIIRAGYVFAHGRNVDVKMLPKIPLAEEGRGMQSRVIRSGLPLCVSEYDDVKKYVQVKHTILQDGSVLENEYSDENEDRTESQLYVPMKIGGKCIGIMQIQSKQKHAYTQEDVDLLSSLANMAAIAIQNARLLKKTREQSLKVEQIVSSVPDGVLLLDANKRLVMANPAAQRYLPLLTDIHIGETLVQLGERPLSELLESPPKGLWHEVVGDNRYFDVIARTIESTIPATADGWVMVLHDVTREKENQNRLEQQNRLAAVGQLAAGIAHDFNNIMTVISLYTDLVERSEDYLSPNALKRLDVISKQSNRAADLIEQILDFSRRSVLERRAMDFLPFLKEVVKLLDRTLIENIHIKLKVDLGAYIINADPTRMQQMLMNLAVNARDAMPNGGQLTFTLSSFQCDGHANGNGIAAEMSPGHWLKLQVSDNGIGIESEVLSRVFDPFFTTKEPGQGSGLGLAQVWGIVKQHEGHITVSTVEDVGTTFTLYLPLFCRETPIEIIDEDLDVVDGSKETILVVEDNKMTREVLVESLLTLNYEVVTAVNGLDALEVMKSQGERITLIISDVVMPEMGGIALLKTLRIGGWETAVILLTGHPLNKELNEALSYPNVEWMSKPVTLEQLSTAINRRLEFA